MLYNCLKRISGTHMKRIGAGRKEETLIYVAYYIYGDAAVCGASS
jgi:hypothetical protein